MNPQYIHGLITGIVATLIVQAAILATLIAMFSEDEPPQER